MSVSVLSDKNQYPSDEIIFSHLNKTKKQWLSIFGYIAAEHPDISGEWRYYNDGKSWLLKVTRKSKTVCWVSVLENAFRMTFYFTEKAKKAILESRISDALKEQFTDGKNYGKIRGITILFRYNKDVDYAKTLLNLKLSIK